jgi:hypothetical protein
MLQQMTDEMVDGPVVMMHVPVINLEEHFGMDKIDVNSVRLEVEQNQLVGVFE